MSATSLSINIYTTIHYLRILVFYDELPMGYDSSMNAYELVCTDAMEIHSIITRTLPVIENFETFE